VIRYRCDPEKELEGVLAIPAENPQKMEALIETAQHRMSETEVSGEIIGGFSCSTLETDSRLSSSSCVDMVVFCYGYVNPSKRELIFCVQPYLGEVFSSVKSYRLWNNANNLHSR